jgi:hypothetical protein
MSESPPPTAPPEAKTRNPRSDIVRREESENRTPVRSGGRPRLDRPGDRRESEAVRTGESRSTTDDGSSRRAPTGGRDLASGGLRYVWGGFQ